MCSLPIGILLALGRRSKMPVVKLFSVIFIEFVRGVPLITVLFMASVMLPLFVPRAWSPDKLLRALVGVAMFASAYMAEVVRAGLQAIPKGQYEGAMALGLGYWQMMCLIILPQALQDHHPEHRQHLYRAVQGHDAGVHRRHLRFPAHRRGRAHRSEMGGADHQRDRLCVRGDVLLHLLLRACRATPRTWKRGSRKADRALNAGSANGMNAKPSRQADAAPSATSPSRSSACTSGTATSTCCATSTSRSMRGERIVICGPSGSGKSTMIRCINRLEEHQQGRIVVDGIELTNDLKKIDEVRREVGMVFQHFNLFPHLTILENCTLAPIWVRKMPKKEAEEIAMHYLTA